MTLAAPPPTRALLDAGRGVAASALAVACSRLGVRVPEDGEDWRRRGVPCLLVSADGEVELDAGLKPPYSGYYEWHPGSPMAVSDACIDAVSQGGLAVSMTTARAYGLQLAAIFAGALAWRLELAEAMAADIEMALQEAVANALVHGNLGISSEPRGDAAGFRAYCATIDDRLADPLLAARRVEVFGVPVPGGVKVTVTDEGLGFELNRELAREALIGEKWGRGLRIISGLARRVETLDGGRRVEMTFL